ncbi:MAG: hypothetical protein IPL87_02895 [Candidatus Moraniibacteriota bacterium]|nr:MAG: hypothetical protein IPL87_02895 [Candidatus Moranbacteria bacterium]
MLKYFLQLFSGSSSEEMKKADREFRSVLERQFAEKKSILESLRDYDAGKKNISTAHLEKRLSGIRDAS